MDYAVVDAVGKIHEKPHDEPNDESYPGNSRQSRHEEDARGDTHKRDERTEGNFESPMFQRFFDAQDNDAETHQDKRKNMLRS